MGSLFNFMSKAYAASSRVIGTQQIIVGAISRPCIATGINQNMKQVAAGYETIATPTCEMLKTDFSDLKVGQRDSVKVQVSGPGEPMATVDLVIHAIENDPADPCVKLTFAIEN